MKRAFLVAALLATTSGVASAGTYLGLGVGTHPAVSSSTGVLHEGDGRTWRLLGGFRLAQFSAEAAATASSASYFEHLLDVRQLMIAGKFNLPLGSGFEAFGKLGLQHTTLGQSAGTDSGFDASGNGYVIGAGIEYRINLAIGSGSLWMDYEYNANAVSGGRFDNVDMSTRMWMLGATVGL